MQYSGAVLNATNQDRQFAVALDDLYQAFATIADPRRAQGRCYWLPSLLCLAVAAILCNCLSVLAIAEWAAAQPADIRAALGLPKQRTPNQSTLHRLFRRLDPAHLSAAMNAYFEQAWAKKQHQRAEQAVAVDGKCRRGQLQFEAEGSCSIHDIEAFCHDIGVVLAQIALANQQGECELAAASKIIAAIKWQGRVLTGDSLYCQVKLCKQVLAEGGDYAVVVKENQPTLYADLALLFAAPEMCNAQTARRLDFDYRQTSTVEAGHGRVEQREIIASRELAGYSGWPGLAQVAQITRTWQQKGQTYVARRYLVTSLGPEIASASDLLRLKREHWGIENSLHWVKDVTLGEDKSLIHVENGGAVMSGLRNIALSLLHRAGQKRIAASLRDNSRHPKQALILMGLLNSSDA